MVKIYVNNLVLEITRRCNMCCDHCLRGDPQCLDIEDEVIKTVAKYIQPFSVVFTGGEPSLNVKAIDAYFREAEKQNHFPSSFFVATNGKENQEKLAIALLKAYPKCEEKEYCEVDISQDIFHEKTDRKNNVLTGLSFYNPKGHAQPTDEACPKWVINEGRAVDTGYGVHDPVSLRTTFEELIESAYLDDDEIYIDELYIAANGLVIDDCNKSYEHIDKNFIFHISALPCIAEDFLKTEKKRS